MARGVILLTTVLTSFALSSSTTNFKDAEPFQYTVNTFGNNVLSFVEHPRHKRELGSLNNTTPEVLTMNPVRAPTSTPSATVSTMPTTTPAAPRVTTKKTSGQMTLGPYPVVEDQHIYYNSKVQSDGMDLWRKLDPSKERIITHKILSNSHKTAVAIKLPFQFLFYGHLQQKITIATGGFLYMSDFLHQFLTATQYIAPLMANFDTTLGSDSLIHYQINQKENPKNLIVQWENVQLNDQPNVGKFSFQVQLYQYGKIVFVYKELPISIPDISSRRHSVKVGLSDAYYRDSIIPFFAITRRTIYEYHKVVINTTLIRTGSAVIIEPLPTCNVLANCGLCLSQQFTHDKFKCGWCASLGQCSDGMDRGRQKWINSGCPMQASKQDCSYVPPTKSPQKDRPKSSDFSTQRVVTLTDATTGTYRVSQTTGTLAGKRRNITQGPKSTSLPKSTSGYVQSLASERSTSVSDQTTKHVAQLATGNEFTQRLISQGTPWSHEPKHNHNASVGLFSTMSSTVIKISSSQTDPGDDDSYQMSSKSPEGTSIGSTVEALSTHQMQAVTNVEGRLLTSTSMFRPLLTLLIPYGNDIENSPNGQRVKGDVPLSGNNNKDAGVVTGVIFGVIVLLMLIVAFIGWIVYAYRNPESRSGQWLIRNRPREVAKRIKFWKKNPDESGEKYAVSMDSESRA